VGESAAVLLGEGHSVVVVVVVVVVDVVVIVVVVVVSWTAVSSSGRVS